MYVCMYVCMYVLQRMLLPRCVDSPRKFLETTRDDMAGNLAESHFICFEFQRTLHSRDVFYTLSCRFVRLGFRLNCARLAAHYFAVYSVLGSFYISKPQWQRQQVQ